jgi:hypothetical protein
MKIQNSELIPLNGKLPEDFTDAVALLVSPYFKISESQYKNLLSEKVDFFKWKNRVVTFGTCDIGYALMPISETKAREILEIEI